MSGRVQKKIRRKFGQMHRGLSGELRTSLVKARKEQVVRSVVATIAAMIVLFLIAKFRG